MKSVEKLLKKCKVLRVEKSVLKKFVHYSEFMHIKSPAVVKSRRASISVVF